MICCHSMLISSTLSLLNDQRTFPIHFPHVPSFPHLSQPSYNQSLLQCQQILISIIFPPMLKPKPRRVNYRINYCSSEDPEYPVSQLALQSSQSKGWQTKRFAPFPQTLIIELLELTVVTNLSFLSHQNKICTKIEIQGKEDHDQNWTRLGYTTLESGINNNYQSRELRNISLGGKVLQLLKFTFHQNYANTINIFNQIGLIALLAYGEKANVQREIVRDKEGGVVANLSELDRQTILKLKNLEQAKKDAVDNNRFQEAKEYKEQIEALQANLKALIVLEREKKESINREEYDNAKEIVERMKRLRGPMFLPPKSGNSYNMMTPKKSVHSSMDNYSQDPEMENNSLNHYKLPSRQSQPRTHNRSFDLNTPKKSVVLVPFDEIKIKPRERYPVEEQLGRDESYSERKKMLPPRYSKPNRKSIQEEEEEHPQTSLPSVKKLEKLTPQQFDQCSRFFPIFNEITFEYLLSRQHSYRQKGIEILNETLNKTSNQDKKEGQDFVIASLFSVCKLIDDKIINILTSTVDFFGMLLKKFRPGPIGAASKYVQHILLKIADYLGHNNQKFRQTCEDVFISLPNHGLTNRELCYEVLCGQYKETARERLPKITIGRLNMLIRMVDKFKLGKSEAIVIDFCKRHLQDKNSDVRTVAVNLMASISQEIGYENLYPELQNLKPQVLKLIQEKVQSTGLPINRIVKAKSTSVQKSSKQPQSLKKQPQNPQYYCDYCKSFDKRFQDDNYRDKHLYSSCPMITLCKECHQAVEITNLNNHLLAECEQHKYYKRCPKCKEAISSRQYATHTKLKECLTAKAPVSANRCPLCHEDIEPGEKGWIKHFVHEKCPKNTR